MIMLRNPVDMVHSLHQQFLTTRNESVASFEDAIDLADERAAGRALPREAHFPDGLLYTRVPLYFGQVERYFRAFGKDRVQVILFEEFSRSAQKVYGEALAFLEVSPQFKPNFVVYNKKVKLRHKWLDDLCNNPSSPLMILPKLLCEAAQWRVQGLNKRFNRIVNKRASISPQVRARLVELFRPNIERLSALLDRDLTSWINAH